MYTDFINRNPTNINDFKISDLNDNQFSWIKNSLVYKNLDSSEDTFLRELKLPICSMSHLNIHDHLNVYDKWCVLEFPRFFYGFFSLMYSKKDFFDIIINSNIHDIGKDEIIFNLISDGNNNLKSLYDLFIIDKKIYTDFRYQSSIIFNASTRIHVSETINGPDISENRIVFKGQFINKLVKDNQYCDLNNDSNIKKNLEFEYDFSIEGNDIFLILTPVFELNNLNLTFSNTFEEDHLNVISRPTMVVRKGVIENNKIKVQINYSRFFYEEDQIATRDNCLKLSIFFD